MDAKTTDSIDIDSISAIDWAFDEQRSAALAGTALRRCPEDYVKLIFGRRFGRAINSGDNDEVLFLAMAYVHWRHHRLSFWIESEMVQLHVLAGKHAPQRPWWRGLFGWVRG